MTAPTDQREQIIAILRRQDEQPYNYGERADEILAALDPAGLRAELAGVTADNEKAQKRIDAVMTLADSLGGPIGQQVRFAAKHGSQQRDLKCEDCSAGDHYHCAHGASDYPRCCCPERLDLGPNGET